MQPPLLISSYPSLHFRACRLSDAFILKIMSWFSRSFSSTFQSRAAQLEEEEEEEQEDEVETWRWTGGATGKGVKEDLSDLTRSFARNLWGTASFLAPPPRVKQLLGEAGRADGKELETVERGADFGSLDSEPDVLPVEDLNGMGGTLDTSGSEGLMNARSSALNVASAVVTNQSTYAAEDTPRSPSWSTSKLEEASRYRLTGVRRDLAELKRSVTSGLSRFVQVVKEEIEKSEVGEFTEYQGSPQDDEVEHEDNESATFSKLDNVIHRFNTTLEPLVGNAFVTEKKVEEDWDPERVDKVHFDSVEHSLQISQPREGYPQVNCDNRLVGGVEGLPNVSSSLFSQSLHSDEENAIRSEKIPQAVGVTDQVLAFARNIAMHPETWIDFPSFSDEEDDDDFMMSEAQREHAVAVELAAARLAALRIELCPGYMSEGRFWKIYFVLLHPRLSKKDAILLSSPEIVEARTLLLRELRKEEVQGRAVSSSEKFCQDMTNNLYEQEFQTTDKVAAPIASNRTEDTSESYKIISLQAATEVPSRYFQQYNEVPKQSAYEDKLHKIDTGDEVQNKDVLVSTVKLTTHFEDEESEADEWLDDEPAYMGSGIGLGNDEDVSFSDLEKEDESTVPHAASKFESSFASNKSVGWVQLDKDSLEEPGRLNCPELCKSSGAEQLTLCHAGSEKGPSDELTKRVMRITDRGECSDWLTVSEDDIACADAA